MAEIRRPKIELPPEFKGDEAEFLRQMRMEFALDESYDHDNREAGIEDLQFLVGKQWDAAIEARRLAKRKPVLTVNRLPAFVAQVLGARLQNETAIKVLPDTGGDKDVAKIREGLMRSIQKVSRAEAAFDNALAGGVSAGIGNFQIDIDYDNDEVWHQSINISPIADHFSVVWDRSRTEPTGADAGRCFIVESMPHSTFMSEYPWATPADIISDRMPAELVNTNWYGRDDVRIVSYWQMRERRRTIALMKNGETVDVTDNMDDPELLSEVAQRPDGTSYMREVYRKYARMYRCSGADVLEGPYDLPIKRVPVFRVPGWEIRIGGVVHRWGLIRHLKDPQRLHNYWRSAIAEKIMQSPKATWMASEASIAGREKEWRESNTSDNPLLIWNSESGQPPVRNAPVQMEDALITQAGMSAQDLKDISNIHEANLGMPSNEVSGKAIQERIGVSETGTVLFHVNLSKAIEECGRTVNDLIPVVYDTARVVRILGEDAEPLMQPINDMTDGSVDITQGKYNVTVSTGPSYKTKRIEQAENMLGMAQAMPNVLGLGADIIVEAQDWPKAERLAERIRMTMDPSMLTENEMTPAVQQSIDQRAQAQQQQVQQAVEAAMVDMQKTLSEIAKNIASARKTEMEAEAIPVETRNNSLRVVSETASRRLQDTLNAIETADPGAPKPSEKAQ